MDDVSHLTPSLLIQKNSVCTPPCKSSTRPVNRSWCDPTNPMKIPDESLWIEVRPKKMPTFEDRNFCIEDSAKAQAILSSLGLLAAIKAAGANLSPRTRLSCYRHHPTHWLLFLIFSAEPDPADNGYQVYGWRKSVYPTDDILAEACARAFEGTPVQRHRTEVVTHPSIS